MVLSLTATVTGSAAVVDVGLSRFEPFGIAPVWLGTSMATPRGHSGEPCAGDLTVTLCEPGAYIDRARVLN